MENRGWHAWPALTSILHLSSSLFHLAAAEPAELVIRHANVITVDTNQPRAESFAVTAGRFVALGSDEKITPLIGPHTKVLDLKGKTVVPGFIDAHLHPRPIYPADSKWARVDCSPANVRSVDDLVAALKRKAERTPVGKWVTGNGYDEMKLGRQPTRADLDRVSTNQPVIISHYSGHAAVCNSFALQLAKVTRDTPDPAGGAFGRDAKGEPNGLLEEAADGIVRAAGPRNSLPPEAETLAAYRECFRQYLSRGITSAHVAGASPTFARTLEKARTQDLPIRLYVMSSESSIGDAAARKKEGRLGDDGVRYGAVKLFHGKSITAHTCWLSKPYADRPAYLGVKPARSQAALNKLVLRVHEAGLQACVHSCGDREIEMVLTAFEYAQQQHPRENPRHRIEHCSIVTEDILRRIQKLGVVVVPQSYMWQHGDAMEAFGEWRWDWIHPARAVLDHGIAMAGHSDSPVSIADPLLHIQDLVTRTSAEGKTYGAKQRISEEEALRSWTLGGAYASFEEDKKGSITVGKLADFVVLAADPTRMKPEAIKDILIEATVVGGRTVFSR
jgi:predicted amidohydrolase YtcJ